jgi:hypothetical protein
MNTHLRTTGAAVTGLAAAATAVVALGGPSVAATTGAGAAGATAVTSATTLPQCTAGDLSVRYHATDAAMSHRFGRIVLTNTSQHACLTGGYVGLSYVGHGDGTQVGAAARRDDSANQPRPLVLKPGGHARAQVSEAVAGVYPRHTCRPEHVDGFRVYPPQSRAALYVAHPTTGCAATRVHLLSVRPLR